VKVYCDILNRLGVGYECNGQTNRQTGGQKNGLQQKRAVTRMRADVPHAIVRTCTIEFWRTFFIVSGELESLNAF